MQRELQFAVFILLFACVGVVIIFLWMFQFYAVSGDSMLPTYKHGDLLLVRNADENLGRDLVGKVIVFQLNDRLFMKRVIAHEGQEVEIKNQSVFINQNRISEPYLAPETSTCIPADCSSRIAKNLVVPEANYFVLGDNRSVSDDSRDCEEGFLCEKSGFRYVASEDITGEVITILPSWLSTLLTSQSE